MVLLARFAYQALLTHSCICRRLVNDLREKKIKIDQMVVNQVLPDGDGDGETKGAFLERRVKNQRSQIEDLERFVAGRNNGAEIELKEIDYVDTELVGIPALSYHAQSTFPSSSSSSNKSNDSKAKFYLFGGKVSERTSPHPHPHPHPQLLN